MNSHRFAVAALLALTSLSSAGLAVAERADRATAVAADGTVYAARTGAYKSLFPGGIAAPANAPVLALDIARADGTASRILVPGTEGIQAEDSPIVLLQEPSADVYLQWSSRTASTASLLLRRYRDGKFSDAIALDEDPQAIKGVPQVAITRDAYTALDAHGAERSVQRTVLHMVWWQGPGSSDAGIFYRAVLFVDGELVGTDDLVALSDLDTAAPDSTTHAADALLRAPFLAGGRNDHSALAGFVNGRTGRLFTLEVAVVPGELSSLADDLRDFTIAAAELNGTDDLTHIGDLVRAHIIGVGRRISDGVLVALGEEVRAHIIGVGHGYGGDAVVLANDTRRFLLREGVNLLENGVDSPDLVAGNTAILELPTDAAGATHQIRLRIMAKHPAPATGETATQLLASPDGTRVLVSWDGPSQLRYTEWRDDSWSAAVALPLGVLSHDDALQALQRRVREH